MSNSSFSHEEIVREGKFSAEDMTEIKKRRRDYNRLGYAYQLAFVRLASRFPAQQPLEIDRELLTYVGMQLSIPDEALERYQNRQQTMAEHRTAILAYQGCRRFGEAEEALLEAFLFEEAGLASNRRGRSSYGPGSSSRRRQSCSRPRTPCSV